MLNEAAIAILSDPDIECRVLILPSGTSGIVLVVYEDAYEKLFVKAIDNKKPIIEVLTQDLNIPNSDALRLLGVDKNEPKI